MVKQIEEVGARLQRKPLTQPKLPPYREIHLDRIESEGNRNRDIAKMQAHHGQAGRERPHAVGHDRGARRGIMYSILFSSQ
jgi:hypothetical protein